MCVRTFTAITGILVLAGPSRSNSDNLVLLLDTLKPIHRTVCDDEPVSLACPVGTSISILLAHYGDNPPSNQECEAVVDRSCKLPNKLQYKLLQRVVEACQKKPSCQFNTNPGEEDPCPRSRKFVEVLYKCRPLEYRRLNACNEQVVHLNCNPYSRIALYDVQYGRNERDTDVKCPQPEGVPEETCSTPYALDTAMRICHGKRRCQFVANRRTFETFCNADTRPYAKVIYACVPLGVLIDRYEVSPELDERGVSSEVGITDQSPYDGNAGVRWREYQPTVADAALLPPEETTTVLNAGKNEVLYKPTNKGNDNFKHYKTFVYVVIGIVGIIILVIVAVGVRCYFAKKAKEIAKNGEMFTAEAPNVFNDAASDMDNDVEISHISGTFYDPVHPDMILYRDADGTRNTLRAMRPLSTIYPCAGPRMYGHVDYVPPQPRDFSKFPRSRSKEEPEPELMTSPKSLGAYSTSQFYYG